MGVDDLDVAKMKAPHISPQEFREVLRDPGTTLILDTRNEFEVEMGSFHGAVNPRMRTFRQFPAIAEGLKPDQPVVMFCTGGMRCKKVSAFLRQRGFKNVRQLEGGILRYLNEFGKSNDKKPVTIFEITGSCEIFLKR